MKHSIFALLGIFAYSVALAETRTVSTASEFVTALQELNGNAANEIVLAAGKSYDVSAYEISTGYHLLISKLTVRGESDDPRAVVIYGNFTKGMANAEAGCLVRNVTFSNACMTSGSTFIGNWSYTAVCSNVVFTCNKGQTGGAVRLITAYDCQFIGNEATASGGAALNLNGARCTFVGNTAPRGGAIASNQRNNEVSDSLFEDNSSTSVKDTEGGGAVCNLTDGSYYTLRHCILRGNESASIGGATASARLLSKCVVSNNVAAIGGGGCAKSIVTSSDIVFNRACNDSTSTAASSYAQGGGLYSSVATDCTIAGNAAYRTQSGTMAFGGGAYGSVLTNCTIRDNFCNVGSALQSGRAVGCVVTNNAAGNKGTTIRDVVHLENCQLYGAYADGPGVCIGCTFSGGGAAAVLAEGENVHTSGTFLASATLFSTSQGSGMAATNCLFTGSVVDTFLYRGNDAHKRQVPFVNCTIAGNRYDNLFSGLKAKPNTMLFENCIVAGNLKKDGTQIRDFYDADPEDGPYVTVRNCLFGTGFASTWSCPNESNVWTNDVVRFSAGRDPEYPFSLRTTSPARGKGLVADWMTSAYDIRGDIEDGKYRRLRDGKVDLGCYQCWAVASGLLFILH